MHRDPGPAPTDPGLETPDELLRSAFHHAPTGIALIGLDGRWLTLNPAACRIIGRPEHDLVGHAVADVTHPVDRFADAAQRELLLAGKIPVYHVRKRYLGATGAEVLASVSVALVRDESGRPRHFVSQLEPASRPERTVRGLPSAAAAPAADDFAGTIISSMHDGYLLVIDGEIKAVNDAVCALTGFDADQLVGSRQPYPFWPAAGVDAGEVLRRELVDADGASVECTIVRADGIRFEAALTSALVRDAGGDAIGFVTTMRDVSAQNRYQRELEHRAQTDSLTGLGNRHVLADALTLAAGRRSGDDGPVALVLLDVDRFKRINDEFGHPTGDAVLVEVARRLEGTVRAGEVLARIGGEEFAWLLPASDPADAVAAAERARAAIAARPFPTAGRLAMSAGVGVMTAPADGDELYRLADRALYQAKQQGRDRTCCQSAAPGAADEPAVSQV